MYHHAARGNFNQSYISKSQELNDTSKGGTDAADQIAGSKDRRSLSFAPEASHDGRQSQVCADLIPPTGMGNFFAAHRFRKKSN